MTDQRCREANQLLRRIAECRQQMVQRNRKWNFFGLSIMVLYVLFDCLAGVEAIVAQTARSTHDNQLLYALATYDVAWFAAMILYTAMGRRNVSFVRHTFGPMQLFLVARDDWAHWWSLFWLYRWLVFARIVSIVAFQHVYCTWSIRRQLCDYRDFLQMSGALDKLLCDKRVRRSVVQPVVATPETGFARWLNRLLDKFQATVGEKNE